MSVVTSTTTRLRVIWEPGSDVLVGICHCGAEHRAEDPVGIWQWLLSHPDHEAEQR
ncbi:hypothetical protein [Actinomadura rudentiformis]|uniref:hypothetical protein n=1 Tax=Actinomadura rudentiformis TaxID=359158 RepID=UPI00178C2564|nr:hypothetical protein [Actinomadura rudentiformis]